MSSRRNIPERSRHALCGEAAGSPHHLTAATLRTPMTVAPHVLPRPKIRSTPLATVQKLNSHRGAVAVAVRNRKCTKTPAGSRRPVRAPSPEAFLVLRCTCMVVHMMPCMVGMHQRERLHSTSRNRAGDGHIPGDRDEWSGCGTCLGSGVRSDSVAHLS